MNHVRKGVLTGIAVMLALLVLEELFWCIPAETAGVRFEYENMTPGQKGTRDAWGESLHAVIEATETWSYNTRTCEGTLTADGEVYPITSKQFRGRSILGRIAERIQWMRYPTGAQPASFTMYFFETEDKAMHLLVSEHSCMISSSTGDNWFRYDS